MSKQHEEDHPSLLATGLRLGLDERGIAALRDLWRLAQREAVLQRGRPDVLAPAPDGTEAGGLHLEGEGTVSDDSTASIPVDDGRFDRMERIGAGGMGEVWRVKDRILNRTAAMKVIRQRLLGNDEAVARFVEEAQCAAQLQHPGIVPVHTLGRLSSGQFFFTMAEVRGRTLSEIIKEVHWAAAGGRWNPTDTGWTFRRLVDAFRRVCEAVAYAHESGVIHRDLKPDNVMLGEHGEVLVLDWGLAKVVSSVQAFAGRCVVTERSIDRSNATRMGAIAGTPAYMPPEQARGGLQKVDVRADVYALGAILYEVLCGRPPYVGANARDVLQKVLSGPPAPIGGSSAAVTLSFFSEVESLQCDGIAEGPPVPMELVSVVERAMARVPDARFPDAGCVAEEVSSWLEGARLREQALEVVARAESMEPKVEMYKDEAARLRAVAGELLHGVEGWQSDEFKVLGWEKEDAALDLEREAARTEHLAMLALYGALRIDPQLTEAHARLALRQMAIHQAAEAARDSEATARAELALADHAGALPRDHEVHRRCAAYLRGDGALTLVTEPAGAGVRIHRFVRKNRRLVPGPLEYEGQTPLEKLSLPMGSYLCVISSPGCAEVRYPVHIARLEHWDGVPPGDDVARPIVLPPQDELAADECYVPAGWYIAGGDAEAPDSLPLRKTWCDGFIVNRFPVLNEEYLEFLDDLASAGRNQEAMRWVPRERSGQLGEEGAAIYGRHDDGSFFLRADADGDVWHPRYPVLMIDWNCASAYCEWRAQRTGKPWRLLCESEWEKAARGVDGRFFPWGDFIDPSWCCLRAAHRERPLPAIPGTFPVDTSVYGVWGMAGSARDWCSDEFEQAQEGAVDECGDGDSHKEKFRVNRGGYFWAPSRYARCAHRVWSLESYRVAAVSMRCARSYPEKAVTSS